MTELKSTKIRNEITELEAQKRKLEELLHSAQTEMDRLKVRRQEISTKAYLGDEAAGQELKLITHESANLTLDEENREFAVAEIGHQIRDKQAELAEALDDERKAAASFKAEELRRLIAQFPDKQKAVTDLLEQIGATASALSLLTNREFDPFVVRIPLENHLAVSFRGSFLNVPIPGDRKMDLLGMTSQSLGRFIQV